MYNQITVAVAGTGFIGPVHVEALRRLGIRVKGVLDISPEASEKARQALGLEKGYASYAELLADEEIMAVHLAVPNVLHYSMSKQALQAGKNVLCEKPLAMNSTETAELVELAKSSGLVAGVAYNIRFYPLNIAAREKVQQKGSDQIFSVVGSYIQDWLLYDTDYNWRVLAEQGGALRAVADIGTHWIDLVTFITGLEVEAVLADLATVHPIRKRPLGEVETFSGKESAPIEREEIPITTEDCGSILFRFKGGAKGSLWVSQVSAGRKNCLQYDISLADTSIMWNSQRPNELFFGHRDEPNQVLLKDPGLASPSVQHFIDFPGGHNEGFPDAFKQCFRSFYDTVLGKTSPEEALYANFESGHHEVVLCEAILKSHQEGRWISL